MRAQLLAQAGIAAVAVASDVDEAPIKREARDRGLSAGEAALALAAAKSLAVARRMSDHLVLGADQILSLGDVWFDKPTSIAQARSQLRRQRGRPLILHTAAAFSIGQQTVWSHLTEPRVDMREFSDHLLELYLGAEGDRLLDCVGACRLEGPGQLLISRIEGEHAAMLGLPMLALIEALRGLGVLVG